MDNYVLFQYPFWKIVEIWQQMHNAVSVPDLLKIVDVNHIFLGICQAQEKFNDFLVIDKQN